MEYWVAKNEKKEGPLKGWEVREKISEEELKKTDLVWCAGLDEWEELGAHSSFRSEFEKPEPVLEGVNELETRAQEELKAKGLKLKRIFAKIFDYYLYSSLFFAFLNILISKFGISYYLFLLGVLKLVPFILIEGWLLRKWGVTPGKWLLNLKVVSLPDEKEPLSKKAGLVRAFVSWFIGGAMGILPLALMTMTFTFYDAKRKGSTIWGRMSKTRLKSIRPLSIINVVRYCTLSLCLVSFTQQVSKMNPQIMEELFEKIESNMEGVYQKYPELKPSIKEK